MRPGRDSQSFIPCFRGATGFDRRTGNYTGHGIPAPLPAEYLRENRIVAEKNDLHSILFLLTPGVENSRAWTVLIWILLRAG
jgi:arginine/lysine/ornithine decarboxylase